MCAPLTRSVLSGSVQVPRVDVDAVVQGEVLRVSNRTCEAVLLKGNTLECTLPSELQAGARGLEVEVRAGPSPTRSSFPLLSPPLLS